MITLPKNCVTNRLRRCGFFISEIDERYLLVPSLKDIHYTFYSLVRKKGARVIGGQKAAGPSVAHRART